MHNRHAMMARMKIYTATGDDGTTGLFDGSRVSKTDLRVESYGCVDELNSQLGLAAVACDNERLHRMLALLQPRLFDLGSDLATPLDPKSKNAAVAAVPRIAQKHIEVIERCIDDLWGDLPEMRHFILPGGTELAARLHVARTVCRRAERVIVALAASEPINESAVIFVNRISDLLFAMARYANHAAGRDDVPWIAEKT